MKLLETEFRKTGYDYKQEYRSETAAVYSQSFEGKVIAYEAIEIIKAQPSVVFGKEMPEREVYPGTEMWGTKGFTHPTKEIAIARVKAIEEAVEAKGLALIG